MHKLKNDFVLHVFYTVLSDINNNFTFEYIWVVCFEICEHCIVYNTHISYNEDASWSINTFIKLVACLN